METGLFSLLVLWLGAERCSWISILICLSPSVLVYRRSYPFFQGDNVHKAQGLKYSRCSRKDNFYDADNDSISQGYKRSSFSGFQGRLEKRGIFGQEAQRPLSHTQTVMASIGLPWPQTEYLGPKPAGVIVWVLPLHCRALGGMSSELVKLGCWEQSGWAYRPREQESRTLRGINPHRGAREELTAGARQTRS